MLYHVSHEYFELPTVLSPGRWGRQTRALLTTSMISAENRAILLWETLLESKRREVRPDAVSRLACVFACETLAAAVRFRDKSKTGAVIYVAEPVEPELEFFRGNLETLSGDGTSVPLIDWYLERSEQYWRESGKGEYIEVLSASPLLLTGRVER